MEGWQKLMAVGIVIFVIGMGVGAMISAATAKRRAGRAAGGGDSDDEQEQSLSATGLSATGLGYTRITHEHGADDGGAPEQSPTVPPVRADAEGLKGKQALLHAADEIDV